MFFKPTSGPSPKHQGGEFGRLKSRFNTSVQPPPIAMGGLRGVNLGASRIRFHGACKRFRSSPRHQVALTLTVGRGS